MDEQVRKFHGHNSSDLWVCIHPDSRPLSGVLLMSCIDVPMPFEGLDDLILRANSVFDAIEFPQRYMARRSISKRPSPIPDWISEHLREPASTQRMDRRLTLYGNNTRKFFVRVRMRQNASWQGEFTDCAGKCSKLPFRSALELMEMISEAAETTHRWMPAPYCVAAEAVALEG